MEEEAPPSPQPRLYKGRCFLSDGSFAFRDGRCRVKRYRLFKKSLRKMSYQEVAAYVAMAVAAAGAIVVNAMAKKRASMRNEGGASAGRRAASSSFFVRNCSMLLRRGSRPEMASSAGGGYRSVMGCCRRQGQPPTGNARLLEECRVRVLRLGSGAVSHDRWQTGWEK